MGFNISNIVKFIKINKQKINMNKQECPLNKIFDKIFVIHCIENESRLKNIQFQQEQSGLNLEIHETCYFPWSQQAVNGLILSNRGRYIVNGSEFNLTREFYSIIKRSYLKGLEHILIFEDDFNLMKNEYLEEFVDNIPNDFDIIQFSILANREILPDYREIQNEYEAGKHFIECKKGYWSNCGLALSRKGMKYFIDAIDKEFLAADIVAFEDTNKIYFFGKNNIKSGLKHYIPTVPLVYLNDLGDSKIQETSKAELYEYYTHIDKQFYNILHNVK